MAHEVDSIAWVGLPPWHGLGVSIDRRCSALEAMNSAGLGWIVEKKPMFYGDAPAVTLAQGVQAITRSDNNSLLGVATSKYKPFQNHEAFSLFQRVLDTGMAEIEVAGALRGGKVVWALAKVNSGPEAVHSNDKVQQYVLLSTSHDAKGGIKVGFTNVRIVCANTMSMAENSSGSRLLRVAHRGNVKDNVKALIDAMDLSVQEFRATVEDYRRMLNTSINQADLREYVRVTLGLVEKEGNKRATNIVDKVVGLASAGRGNGYAAGTVWGAMNGVTEYLTHVAGRSNDSRLNSLWFGNNKVVLKRAHEEAMWLVA